MARRKKPRGASGSHKVEGRARPLVRIPRPQWELPVSFTRDGEPVSLRQYVSGDTHAIPFPDLTEGQRVDLTVRRIGLQPRFEMGVLSSSLINKERAIAEVKERSEIGRALVGIEERVITCVIEEAGRRRAASGAAR